MVAGVEPRFEAQILPSPIGLDDPHNYTHAVRRDSGECGNFGVCVKRQFFHHGHGNDAGGGSDDKQ